MIDTSFLHKLLDVRLARFLENKFRDSNMGPRGLSEAQNEVFCRFLEFGSLVFLELAYNNSLQ